MPRDRIDPHIKNRKQSVRPAIDAAAAAREAMGDRPGDDAVCPPAAAGPPPADDEEIVLQPELASDAEELDAHIIVRSKRIDQRLDSHIAATFPRFSRNGIQQLIHAGLILVNGRITKNSYRLKAGDRVDLRLPPPTVRQFEPEPMDLQVLYEDEHLIVLNKPAGLIVHPGRGHWKGTLINGLVHHLRAAGNSGSGPAGVALSTAAGDVARPGIVHRLDRDTTGCIVVAKNDEAHWRLAVAFERREVDKQYFAIGGGLIPLQAQRIETLIDKHPKVREKMAVCTTGGKHADTTVHPMAAWEVGKAARQADSSLPRGFVEVRCVLGTGRTHQIRVHMAHIGCPLVGDALYGGCSVSERSLLGEGSEDCIFQRQALHAWRLGFSHPISQRPMQFEAPFPADLLALQRLIHRLPPMPA